MARDIVLAKWLRKEAKPHVDLSGARCASFLGRCDLHRSLIESSIIQPGHPPPMTPGAATPTFLPQRFVPFLRGVSHIVRRSAASPEVHEDLSKNPECKKQPLLLQQFHCESPGKRLSSPILSQPQQQGASKRHGNLKL